VLLLRSRLLRLRLTLRRLRRLVARGRRRRRLLPFVPRRPCLDGVTLDVIRSALLARVVLHVDDPALGVERSGHLVLASALAAPSAPTAPVPPEPAAATPALPLLPLRELAVPVAVHAARLGNSGVARLRRI
jgi:hypothetical protein